MKKAIRTIVYDEELQIEAYRFVGFMQPFPSHFHEYYVVGYVEAGQRALICKDQEYMIGPGHILLFNPGDSHACTQSGDGSLDYRGFNISRNVLLNIMKETENKSLWPVFSPNVVMDEEAASCLCMLHRLVMSGAKNPEKADDLRSLMVLLVQRYGGPLLCQAPQYSEEIERVCTFMERRYSERICLNQLCRCAGMSRSTLLRAFTRVKGVTPYRYLENIRIGYGKKLLEQGVLPAETALRTGFSDQSHFTNCFVRFIGLSPGVYQEIFEKSEKRNENGLEK